jgi:hypothetical protein
MSYAIDSEERYNDIAQVFEGNQEALDTLTNVDLYYCYSKADVGPAPSQYRNIKFPMGGRLHSNGREIEVYSYAECHLPPRWPLLRKIQIYSFTGTMVNYGALKSVAIMKSMPPDEVFPFLPVQVERIVLMFNMCGAVKPRHLERFTRLRELSLSTASLDISESCPKSLNWLHIRVCYHINGLRYIEKQLKYLLIHENIFNAARLNVTADLTEAGHIDLRDVDLTFKTELTKLNSIKLYECNIWGPLNIENISDVHLYKTAINGGPPQNIYKK